MSASGHGWPRLLRRVASRLIRSPDARFILDDLDELLARDLERGMPRWRAVARYVRNALVSAVSVRRGRAPSSTRGGGRRGGGVRGADEAGGPLPVRARRGRPRLPRLPGISWLDLKLGARMLVKHPGLTLVATFALAIAIPVALIPPQLWGALSAPLPFEDGERIVGIENRDIADSQPEQRSLHDYEAWRAGHTSFEALGAANSGVQNLVTGDGSAAPVRGSVVSASTFDVVRVRPLFGRVLVEADEQPGAEPVVVLGHDLWRSRLGADPRAVGRRVELGGITRTIVGVMPEGFLFPYSDHFWVPLQARAVDYERLAGPSLWIYGRLADGVSLERAQAELTAVGIRAAADHPSTHERLRPVIVPFMALVTGLGGPGSSALPARILCTFLLAVACGNVGTLMLARASTRSNEIAVRTALGATRGRVVGQLFVEALLLALLAAAAGLAFGDWLVGRMVVWNSFFPFWFDLGLTPATVVYAILLAAFSAGIAGAVPALKATGSDPARRLQGVGKGAGSIRFGVLSTVLVVAEVALGVGFLTAVGAMTPGMLRSSGAPGIPADRYLAARLLLPRPVVPDPSAPPDPEARAARVGRIQEEIERRLLTDPAVRAVTFASALPGMDHPVRSVEVEGAPPSPSGAVARTATVQVASGYFEELERGVEAGRGFGSADAEPASRVVAVNRSFVQHVLGGRSAIGQRIRYPGGAGEPPGPWYEIVGVVPNLGTGVTPEAAAAVYHPAGPGRISPLRVAVRLASEPVAFIPQLRRIAAEVEPALIVEDATPLDQAFSIQRWGARWSALLFGLLAAIALALSAAGLYALVSFTVSERRREIGIRISLGAQSAGVVRSVVARALLQVGVGIGLGAPLAAGLVGRVGGSVVMVREWPLVLSLVSALMLAIAAGACARPTLRALGIQPSEALRE